MIPEFGNFALILALCLALVQTSLPMIGSFRGNAAWMQLARPSAYAHCTFLLVAFACLTWSFIQNDFSVAYVATNSHTQLPLFYRITAVWGAHEGSMLLWVTCLSVWTAAVARFSRQLPLETMARVIAILGVVSIGFLLFIILTSSPFDRLLPFIPQQGRDLNPLLQDPGLISHPPMLYMGYVGFSVAFAFAIAALIGGKLDTQWARWMRPWTLAAWSFLTLGIVLGSWWSYRVLGWGGWWAWDPVENASFMPWLMGTALIHCLAVTEKRGAFKGWTALMAILAFSLSLLGTFLVRSGILTSVHAFAVDPKRGAFILIFLFIVIGFSLAIYAVRAHTINEQGRFELISRETALLSNNVILTIVTLTILLGTLYPLIIDAFHAGKISVGAPYFNHVFIPLMVPLFLLMGFGPWFKWRESAWKSLLFQCRVAIATSLGIALLIYVWLTHRHLTQALLGLGLACWILAATLTKAYQQIRMKTFKRKQGGMSLAHVGVAVCMIGITMSSVYGTERSVVVSPGDTAHLKNYAFHFDDLHDVTGPNYEGVAADFTVKQNGKTITHLVAEKHYFPADDMAMTEAGIQAGLFRDLYLALGNPLEGQAWTLRLYYKPFVRWIWLGGLLMLFGGILAATHSPSKKKELIDEHHTA